MLSTFLTRLGGAAVPAAGPLLSMLVPVLIQAATPATTPAAARRKIDIRISID